MKIRLRKSDKLFTQLIRIEYNFTCQKCGRIYAEDGNLYNLGVSHYYSRSRESTRFDPDNVTLLCNFPCHRKWETEERAEYMQYMVKRLGQEGFDLLTLRANTYQKRDDKLVEIYLLEKIKQLEE